MDITNIYVDDTPPKIPPRSVIDVRDNEEDEYISTDIDDTESTASTASTKNVIDVPCFGMRTNTKTALFWTQLAISTSAIAIATTFVATGTIPVSVFVPILSGVIFAWLPNPSL